MFLTYFKGGTPRRNVERYFQGNIAWATPTDITNLNGALYIDDTATHISEEALGKKRGKIIACWDCAVDEQGDYWNGSYR